MAHLIPADAVGENPLTLASRVLYSSAYWTDETTRSLNPMQYNYKLVNSQEGDEVETLTVRVDETSQEKRKIPTAQSLKAQTEHLPPVGTQARKSYEEFQLTLCPHGAGNQTWQQVTHETIDKMFVTIQKVPDSRILRCGVISNTRKHGANINKHYETMSCNLLALTLYCASTGTWSSNLSSLTRLSELKEGGCEIINMDMLSQQDIFYNFVAPLLSLAVLYMNPERYLTFHDVIRKNVFRSIQDAMAKAQKCGVWVSRRVVQSIQEGRIRQSDFKLCHGMEYSFFVAFMKLGHRNIQGKPFLGIGIGYKTIEDDGNATGDINENGVTVTSMVSNRPE
jgi:hypothetical protein